MSTQLLSSDLYRILGYELPNHRHNPFHIIDWNRTWSTDLTKFPGAQNSFPFEDAIAPIGNQVQQLSQTYWHYSIHISALYILVIFSLQKWMQNRKAFNLRVHLVWWNFFLAAFSILGVYRCLPEFVNILYKEGFAPSYTKASYYVDYRLSVWYLLFCLSKVLELIDTLFVVLRKSKLIALHWIHHVLTLIFSWYAFVDVPGTARWMVNMNFVVHSLMYSYYGLKAMRVPIPRQVNLSITSLQVTQMFVGLYINYDCLKRKLMAQPVDISYSTAFYSFILYFIFTVLFLNYFTRTYILSSKRINRAFSYITGNIKQIHFVKKLQ